MSKHDAELTQTVVSEVAERLDILHGLVLDIEDDSCRHELLDEFMRAAHTLKGTAGMVGLNATSSLAHSIESIVESLRDGRLRPRPDLFDRLSRALDVIERSLPDVVAGRAEAEEITRTRQDLDCWLLDSGGCAGNEAPSIAERGGFPLGEYDRLRVHSLEAKGRQLYRVTLPVLANEFDAVFWATDVLRTLNQHSTVITTLPSSSQLLRLTEYQQFKALVASELPLGEFSTSLSRAGLDDVNVERVEGEPSSTLPTIEAIPTQKFACERILRVELSALDELLRLVGELMISRDRYQQVASEFVDILDDAQLSGEIASATEQLRRLSSELQDAVMRARMVPVGRLFRRVRRDVRRAARAAECFISFETEGESYELDKSLVDSLAEPLAKFVSELLTEQITTNEARNHSLRIVAERQWNHVVLTVTAHGTQATERAVRTFNVDLAPCGGRLEVNAHGDEATRYVISLPLNLAIIQAIMSRVGNEIYAFPIEAVRETLRFQAHETTVMATPVFELRGHPLPLLSLRDFFDTESTGTVGEQRILVLGDVSARIGVVVDQLIGIREVVIKPLGTRLTHIDVISGSAILGDEQIALILNADALVASALRRSRALDSAAPRAGRNYQEEVSP